MGKVGLGMVATVSHEYQRIWRYFKRIFSLLEKRVFKLDELV